MGTIHKEEKRPRSNQREEQTKEPPPIITTTMNARAIRGARAVAGARSARVAQAARVARVSRRSLTLRAKAQDMSDALEEAINEAKETCEDDPKKADCAVAWDNVSARAPPPFFLRGDSPRFSNASSARAPPLSPQTKEPPRRLTLSLSLPFSSSRSSKGRGNLRGDL